MAVRLQAPPRGEVAELALSPAEPAPCRLTSLGFAAAAIETQRSFQALRLAALGELEEEELEATESREAEAEATESREAEAERPRVLALPLIIVSGVLGQSPAESLVPCSLSRLLSYPLGSGYICGCEDIRHTGRTHPFGMGAIGDRVPHA